jgi:hypothetical protein
VPPAPRSNDPDAVPPPGATDCRLHVCDGARAPGADVTAYAPRRRLGLPRGVLAQSGGGGHRADPGQERDTGDRIGAQEG